MKKNPYFKIGDVVIVDGKILFWPAPIMAVVVSAWFDDETEEWRYGLKSRLWFFVHVYSEDDFAYNYNPR